MTLVSTVTVGSGGAASIDFTSIPQTGTDLLVVLSGRPTGTEANIQMYFNSDTTDANYSMRRLLGNGSSASSQNGSYPMVGYVRSDNTANTFNSLSIYIPNYSGSAAKSYSSDNATENNGTTSYQELFAGKWTGTSAITALKLNPTYGTSWAQYSTASLYTITKGSGGATVS